MDGVTEDNEEFPGNYILYNKDDDDNDGVIDYDDTENTAEDDLVRIIPHWVEPAHCLYGSYCSISGSVTFNVSPAGTKVKVWESQTKVTEVNLPETYNTPDDLPKEFWVEGIDESDGPGDVVFTLTHNGLGFQDKVKVTVVHVELFIDAGYTQILDDWPKDGDHLRSPKYIFGEDDPIYVRVKNIGKDPDEAENFYAAVAVKSQYSPYIYLSLQETGVDTQIFAGELLYVSDGTDIGNKKTWVIDEEVLNFWLTIPIGSTAYKRSEDVMVDRAEIGVEWQKYYDVYCSHGGLIFTERFGEQLYCNIGGEPGLLWFKNFDRNNLDSLPSHWKPPGDSVYADSVDITSWSGHSWGITNLHFFTNSSCIDLPRADMDLGDTDAEWVIFDTCWFLDGDANNLKTDLLSSNPNARSAHMFLGFAPINDNPDDWVMTYWRDLNCGKIFADLLEDMSIQEAWFEYCDETQYKGCKARVFRPIGPLDDYSGESLAGPGPIEVLRDPIPSDDWKIKDHINTTGPDPP